VRAALAINGLNMKAKHKSNGKFISEQYGLSFIIKPGDRVRIISARHPDVIPGTLGVVDCLKEDGYGVRITGSWQIAGEDHGLCTEETKVVWFEKEHVVKV